MVPDSGSLKQMLDDARARTLSLAGDLSGDKLLGPRLDIVNPPLWEIGHVAWFQERWCLRRRPGGMLAPSMLEHADSLYDSSAVPHATRWELPLPSLERTLAYLQDVQTCISHQIANGPTDEETAYFAQLAALHEAMHAEAFTYSRQTLAYADPARGSDIANGEVPAGEGDVEIRGGSFRLGAERDAFFVFDNEKWAHDVQLAPFAIARKAVTNGDYCAFVADGGYSRAELWCADGWRWRVSAAADKPVYWNATEGRWCERVFDRVLPLAADLPVMHVNWYEADAYCRWAGRRLPSEAEWECAAAGYGAPKRQYAWGAAMPDANRANLFGAAGTRLPASALPHGETPEGCRQMIGNVWEWTAEPFRPYPGFLADPYAEYSAPWFGTHKVLRGGAYATSPVLIRNTWRNFYTPDRRDVFAGFRTCAL